MNTHIPTLLQREWMQHKRGWLITALAPPLIFLAMLPFGEVTGLPMDRAELMAVIMVLLSACVVYGICMLVALFQLPGLARRDTQDRSIEFWLSLPGRPSESVLSTVLAHAWLAPLGGAVIGLLFGLPIALGVLASRADLTTALGLDWAGVLAVALPLALRGLAGTLPLLLWLAPLIFTLMAASAWLKRLGVPVVLVGGGVGVSLLHKVYDIDWPLHALQGWSDQINRTMVHDPRGMGEMLKEGENAIGWAVRDLGGTLAELVSLQFAGWMAVAAAAFTLIVIKRARGG